jgi:branched-chain amino acid transport system ATP-binding protein
VSLEARLHLAGGTRRLDLPAGAVAEVDRDVVTHLRARVDRRDRIRVAGRRVDRQATAGRVRHGLALVTGAPVAGDVSVRDHLAAVTPRARADAIVDEAPLLAGRGGDPAGVLSGGERRVLALLRAAAVAPRVVVLDAAGAGLDAATLAWAGELVAGWRHAGAVVLVRVGRPEERRWLADPARA